MRAASRDRRLMWMSPAFERSTFTFSWMPLFLRNAPLWPTIRIRRRVETAHPSVEAHRVRKDIRIATRRGRKPSEQAYFSARGPASRGHCRRLGFLLYRELSRAAIMVAQVLADAAQLVHRAMRRAQAVACRCRRAEKLRRVYRPPRRDFAGSRARAARRRGIADADAALAFEYQALRHRAPVDTRFAASGGSRCIGCALAATLGDGHLDCELPLSPF